MVQPRASQLLIMLVDIATASVLNIRWCLFFYIIIYFIFTAFSLLLLFLNLVYHCKQAKYRLPI